MKKLILKPGYVLLQAEITFLCGLKPNAPDTDLLGSEKKQLSNIYYKYFGSNETLSKALIENEMSNKWPGNERKKTHECQRAIMDILHRLNVALTPAGPIDNTPVTVMDLSFVMSYLTAAKANEITILTIATDVVTEAPVIDKGADITVNGKSYNVSSKEAVTFDKAMGMAFGNQTLTGSYVVKFTNGPDGTSGDITLKGGGILPVTGMAITCEASGSL